MNKLAIILGLITAFSCTSLLAKNTVKIKTIGKSPKGQYVAFEEFGFKNNQKIPYSRIRVMNMWKNKYVDTPVDVVGTKEDAKLKDIRMKAKKLAQDKLKKFNINS